MNKKYELTEESFVFDGHKLFRIKALRSFSNVKEGDLGGYIEKETNLSHEDHCWVYYYAKVSGDAVVCDNANVFGSAQVSGEAVVCGNAKVYGSAFVSGDARVYGNAKVYDYARVFGSAQVYDKAVIDYRVNSGTHTGAIKEDLKLTYNLRSLNKKTWDTLISEQKNEIKNLVLVDARTFKQVTGIDFDQNEEKKLLLEKAEELIQKANELKAQAEKL